MQLGLEGRIALVTGAGSGIGRAVAQALAAEGVIVHCADRSSAAAAATVAGNRAQDGAGNRAQDGAGRTGMQALTLDVTDPASIEAAMQTISASGGLDILVTSAGILKTGSVATASAEDWDTVERVNLRGVLHCVQAVIGPMMARGSGRIINIASVSAFRGGGALGNVLYGTTKAGVAALTMGLARELGPAGITVNAIAPAVTATAMTASQLDSAMQAAILRRIPVGRLASPDDTASLAVFLASERASYITGTIIPVDGGYLTT